MIHKANQVIEGKHSKPILMDIRYELNNTPKPIIIFCHGYKGFKDWGAWNITADNFSKAGFCFIKFNFSHNGGTVEQPIDFPDLEAFAENNYTKELDDLDSVINYLFSKDNPCYNDLNTNNITLIGHSRGGGITTIKASEDSRITTLITWASVCDFNKRTASIGDLEAWKNEGVKYVLNGRTKQQMPHNYQFYEDFKANEKRLNIETAAKQINIPHLIIHGDNDTNILLGEAKKLHRWNPNSELKIIDGANHVFETAHPWKKKELSKELLEVVNTTISFI